MTGANVDSVFRNFAALPQRAIGDRRFKARHYRVLAAVCRAVDKATGLALISQGAVSRWASLARQKVGAVTDDLEAWGYLERVRRGRRPNGKFLTLQYQVNYTYPQRVHTACEGDTGAVTLEGDFSESPTGAAESDSYKSDVLHRSEVDGTVSENLGTAKNISNPCAHPYKGSSNAGQSDGRTRSRSRNTLGKQEYERMQHIRQHASSNVMGDFFEAYDEEARLDALDVITNEMWEAAVEAELVEEGKGVRVLSRLIEEKSPIDQV